MSSLKLGMSSRLSLFLRLGSRSWLVVAAAVLFGAASPSVQAQQAPPSQAATPAQSQKAEAKGTYKSCHVEGPYVALTFDDGPDAKCTPQLLDLLKEKGVKATFFVLGQRVEANPALVARAAAEGHEIGNHSYDHKFFTRIGMDGVKSQIERTNAAIEAAIGKKPTLVRPPYGATDPEISRLLNADYGMTIVMWDVDPLDWKIFDSANITAEVLKNAKPGSIVLSHDVHQTTVDSVAHTIDGLRAKGFQFITVSDLIAMDRPQIPAASPSDD